MPDRSDPAPRALRCPSCGREAEEHRDGTLPDRDSNRLPDRIMLEIAPELLPAIVHALMIGGNTAMMCQKPGVESALRALSRSLGDQVSPLARHFSEEAWFRLFDEARAGRCHEAAVVRFCQANVWDRRVVLRFSAPADGDPCVTDRPISSAPFEREAEANAVLERLENLLAQIRPLS